MARQNSNITYYNIYKAITAKTKEEASRTGLEPRIIVQFLEDDDNYPERLRSKLEGTRSFRGPTLSYLFPLSSGRFSAVAAQSRGQLLIDKLKEQCETKKIILSDSELQKLLLVFINDKALVKEMAKDRELRKTYVDKLCRAFTRETREIDVTMFEYVKRFRSVCENDARFSENGLNTNSLLDFVMFLGLEIDEDQIRVNEREHLRKLLCYELYPHLFEDWADFELEPDRYKEIGFINSDAVLSSFYASGEIQFHSDLPPVKLLKRPLGAGESLFDLDHSVYNYNKKLIFDILELTNITEFKPEYYTYLESLIDELIRTKGNPRNKTMFNDVLTDKYLPFLKAHIGKLVPSDLLLLVLAIILKSFNTSSDNVFKPDSPLAFLSKNYTSYKRGSRKKADPEGEYMQRKMRRRLERFAKKSKIKDFGSDLTSYTEPDLPAGSEASRLTMVTDESVDRDAEAMKAARLQISRALGEEATEVTSVREATPSEVSEAMRVIRDVGMDAATEATSVREATPSEVSQTMRLVRDVDMDATEMDEMDQLKKSIMENAVNNMNADAMKMKNSSKQGDQESDEDYLMRLARLRNRVPKSEASKKAIEKFRYLVSQLTNRIIEGSENPAHKKFNRGLREVLEKHMKNRERYIESGGRGQRPSLYARIFDFRLPTKGYKNKKREGEKKSDYTRIYGKYDRSKGGYIDQKPYYAIYYGSEKSQDPDRLKGFDDNVHALPVATLLSGKGLRDNGHQIISYGSETVMQRLSHMFPDYFFTIKYMKKKTPYVHSLVAVHKDDLEYFHKVNRELLEGYDKKDTERFIRDYYSSRQSQTAEERRKMRQERRRQREIMRLEEEMAEKSVPELEDLKIFPELGDDGATSAEKPTKVKSKFPLSELESEATAASEEAEFVEPRRRNRKPRPQSANSTHRPKGTKSARSSAPIKRPEWAESEGQFSQSELEVLLSGTRVEDMERLDSAASEASSASAASAARASSAWSGSSLPENIRRKTAEETRRKHEAAEAAKTFSKEQKRIMRETRKQLKIDQARQQAEERREQQKEHEKRMKSGYKAAVKRNERQKQRREEKDEEARASQYSLAVPKQFASKKSKKPKNPEPKK
jgi:hypothetical protein